MSDEDDLLDRLASLYLVPTRVLRAEGERKEDMSDEPKPWAEPGLTIEERALAAVRGYWAAEGDARHSMDHFFAEALRAARADALDEAAKACERTAEEWDRDDSVYAAADAIRALKDVP